MVIDNYGKCGKCGEVVETWTLEEVFINNKIGHLDVCHKCINEGGLK